MGCVTSRFGSCFRDRGVSGGPLHNQSSSKRKESHESQYKYTVPQVDSSCTAGPSKPPSGPIRPWRPTDDQRHELPGHDAPGRNEINKLRHYTATSREHNDAIEWRTSYPLTSTTEGVEHEVAESPSTPSWQGYEQEVVRLITVLRKRGNAFISDFFHNESEEYRTRLRARLFHQVIEPNKDKEEDCTRAAKRLVRDLPEILPLSDANRANSDLVAICDADTQLRKAMENDAGAWKPEWNKDGQNLEFPMFLRDQVIVFEGVKSVGTLVEGKASN
ncbi:hypothetical protein H2202_006231 [Exophiala xenobiotica]|nr:hypothetical protein H2202_006231 [Exophiala xenobiotica]KAK5203817.1 hypothetical protein LTR41_010502 [Exophiala xenobiotica]KAK5216274.1 hypothetical protein LTR72_010668 [Exophiala xenobiotica]KAK5224318.1 hypothetical protein LTR47_009753 [Exophiala xenobiotica]KAK5247734.1 hypothetical protein LTS06_007127 [Exophiala xenobiotica]